MTAQTIDGNALARAIRAEVSGRTAALKARGVSPQLNIILVGEDPASQVYVRSKGKQAVELATKACELTQWANAGYIDTKGKATFSGEFRAEGNQHIFKPTHPEVLRNPLDIAAEYILRAEVIKEDAAA